MNSPEKMPQSQDGKFEVDGYQIETIDRPEAGVVSCQLEIPRSDVSKKFGEGSNIGLDGNEAFFKKLENALAKAGCRASGAVYGSINDTGGNGQDYGKDAVISLHLDKQKVGDRDVKKIITDIVSEVMGE